MTVKISILMTEEVKKGKKLIIVCDVDFYHLKVPVICRLTIYVRYE